MKFCANTIDELRMVMGEDFPSFVQSFLDDSARRLYQLEQQLEAQLLSELARGAHSFKGSAANVGALALADSCQQLESRAKTGDIPGLQDAIQLSRQEWLVTKHHYMALLV